MRKFLALAIVLATTAAWCSAADVSQSVATAAVTQAASAVPSLVSPSSRTATFTAALYRLTGTDIPALISALNTITATDLPAVITRVNSFDAGAGTNLGTVTFGHTFTAVPAVFLQQTNAVSGLAWTSPIPTSVTLSNFVITAPCAAGNVNWYAVEK